eukprot:CAMPEP_0171615854 /NCGR_PEP_ID=MMETSP0990-20121206/13127_1 /TAXON_ID=483369 /ORGANISM="non described non described, Strain CCMP2098" /LENGTH=39 /DNA_ID= /DNA_START= /DNA_END= /DNA_ORIENTATION=
MSAFVPSMWDIALLHTAAWFHSADNAPPLASQVPSGESG